MQAVPPPDEPHVIHLPPPSPSATAPQWILGPTTPSPTSKQPVYRELTASEREVVPIASPRSTHADLWAALAIMTAGIVTGVILRRRRKRLRNDFRPLPYHEFPTLPNRDDIIDID